MSVKGIIFTVLAIAGAVLNFTSRPVSKKLNASELKIKIAALIIVLAAVVLLFVFGK